ncbi:sulfite oxidase heme-binding subunit YedZ [Bryobacter aggregatus]|uniref:sulfite oxidase heme-binding subunit YedZ n=1 Tax=Bryobacter aggregatus TaxID=360054 RepID=UPI001EE1A590|nr:protein-methionine-sulfoxide reductase heme-binding subunit MsrQ [Bryobacter aggregatus]
MKSFWRSAAWKPAVFLLSLVPLAHLVWRFENNDLGPNPLEELTHVTGDWAIWFLLLSLAITPLRRLLGQPDLIRFRRLLGLFAAFYAVLHTGVWAYFDKQLDPTELIADLTLRRFIIAGMISLVILLILAATSTNASIRFLGKNWRRLHRLVYLAAALAVLHYYWLVKADTRLPLSYAGILLLLLLARTIPLRSNANLTK